MRRFDVVVLGAGMVGLGTALGLQAKGRSVALVDRRPPAEETSYGNAGLIQAEAVVPYAFPRQIGTILGVLAGTRTDARVAWKALWRTAPWLLQYARSSEPAAVMRVAEANAPLVAAAVPAHEALSARAGTEHLWRRTGYVRLHRTQKSLDAEAASEAAVEARFGIPHAVWDRARLAEEEPHLRGPFVGGIHMSSPVRILDPGDLGKGYAELFMREGGTVVVGDAMGLRRHGEDFALSTPAGLLRAREAVVCLGPWSGDFLAGFGVRVPLGFKRGYHRHYKSVGNTALNHLVADAAHGYVLTPNRRGVRLTTGAEFAHRDDPPTPLQLARVEPVAREIFPLGEAIEPAPWVGTRPCLPDLLPMIGPIPGVSGLWGNFGHHHLGFTLGPATGALLAQMMVGEAPHTDPAPYRVDRF